MAYKLFDAAQDRWRNIGDAEVVPLLRAGSTVVDGKLRERRDDPTEGPTDTVAACIRSLIRNYWLPLLTFQSGLLPINDTV